MNKRQAKKKSFKQYLLSDSYKAQKSIVRHQHQRSIEVARMEHRNYWEEWKRGYPNRFPYKKWFECMVVERNKKLAKHEDVDAGLGRMIVGWSSCYDGSDVEEAKRFAETLKKQMAEETVEKYHGIPDKSFKFS